MRISDIIDVALFKDNLNSLPDGSYTLNISSGQLVMQEVQQSQIDLADYIDESLLKQNTSTLDDNIYNIKVSNGNIIFNPEDKMYIQAQMLDEQNTFNSTTQYAVFPDFTNVKYSKGQISLSPDGKISVFNDGLYEVSIVLSGYVDTTSEIDVFVSYNVNGALKAQIITTVQDGGYINVKLEGIEPLLANDIVSIEIKTSADVVFNSSNGTFTVKEV